MENGFAFSQSVMHVTNIPRNAKQAGIVLPARSLALVVAFCAFAMFVATPGRCQTSPIIEGPHRLPHRSPIAPLAEPAVDTAGAKDLAGLHYKFITIGPESSPYAVAGGINNAGLVAGYYEDTNSVYHGFVWHDGEFKTWTIPAPPLPFWAE